MDVVDQPTCGQGLAENSVLPAKLGQLIASMARVLEVHTHALDLEDPDSRRERDVYLGLAEKQRDAAARLQAIGEEMAGCRDVPMGRHHPEVMTSAEAVGAFVQFVAGEEDLLNMLEARVPNERGMLAEMQRASG
jgi:hypothetical protein